MGRFYEKIWNCAAYLRFYQVTEIGLGCNTSLHMVLIDEEKAFDSATSSGVNGALHDQRVRQPYFAFLEKRKIYASINYLVCFLYKRVPCEVIQYLGKTLQQK